DSQIAGKSILLNGHSFTVVGVASAQFKGTTVGSPTDVWLPLTMQPEAIPRMSHGVLHNRNSGWVEIFGRLKPQVSLVAARSEMQAIAGQLVAFLPGGRTRPAAGTLDRETNSCFPPAALRAAQRGHKSGHPRAGVHADGGLADGSVVLSRARLAGIKARPSRRAKGQRTGI